MKREQKLPAVCDEGYVSTTDYSCLPVGLIGCCFIDRMPIGCFTNRIAVELVYHPVNGVY